MVCVFVCAQQNNKILDNFIYILSFKWKHAQLLIYVMGFKLDKFDFRWFI